MQGVGKELSRQLWGEEKRKKKIKYFANPKKMTSQN